MKTGIRKRGLIASGLWLAGGGWVATGQATLSASQATVQSTAAHPAADAAASPTQTSAARSAGETQRLKVTWADETLTIAAENAGLNQILREVSKRTGMKVTGGVADERVYGSYGPGPAEMVLAGLLTGTKSNMLLKEGAADRPMELILSPRLGGPSPPGPSTYGSVDDDQGESGPVRPSLTGRGRRAGGFGGPSSAGVAPVGSGTPDAAGAGVPTTPDGSQEQGPAVSAPPPSGAGDAQSATPSASEPKSPQEIYDQLMRLQQQKNPQAPTANPPQ